MIDNQTVGRKISALRQKNGLTQQQLAAMMNVSHQAVSKWESGMTLPDIQILLKLTRFFGTTVEDLLSDELESIHEQSEDGENSNEEIPAVEKEETMNMNIQQLMQMAPFMSKSAVDEIALSIEEKMNAAQIARLAPFMHGEYLAKLMEKHKPEMNWDVLRRIAPFIGKDAVDTMARSIASGETKVMPSQTAENLNKTINDISKAIDDIGKGVEHVVKKTLRFGENMINEVSSAFSDLSEDAEEVKSVPKRSEKALAIRRKAFERALQDEKWDWIAAHMEEIDGDGEFKAGIAAKAAEKGMNEWICENLGAYVDAITIDKAIESEDWAWLGENIWQMDSAQKKEISLAAKEAANWEWLENYADQLATEDTASEIAHAALEAGEKQLAVRFAYGNMSLQQVSDLARKAMENDDLEVLDMLITLTDEEFINEALNELAKREDWQRIADYLHKVKCDTVEDLMDTAVEQGNFDAIDMLDKYL